MSARRFAIAWALLLCALSVPSAWAGGPFAREVFLRDVDGMGAVLSEQALRLGVSATSTDGFDAGEDVLAPPPPPGNSYASSLSGLASPLDRLQEDYRADVAAGGFVEWVLEVVAGPDRSARLSWDADMPPGVGFLGIVRSDAMGVPFMGEIETSMAPAGQIEFPGGMAGETRHYRVRMYRGTPVTVMMDSVEGDPTGASPIPVDVLFSEPVAGFGLADIATGNATAGNLMDLGGGAFSFDLTPLGAGLVTADIPAASAQSVAMGIPNEAAPQFSRNFEMDVCCPGDADLSGFVNGLDYASVTQSFGQPGPVGDADCSGFVNGLDYASVTQRFGESCGTRSLTFNVSENPFRLALRSPRSVGFELLPPSPPSAFVGRLVEIQIALSASGDLGGEPVRAAGIFLGFDSSRLRFENGEIDTVLWDLPTYTASPRETEPGLVSFPVGSSSALTQGNFMIATLRFTALSPGETTLELLDQNQRLTQAFQGDFSLVATDLDSVVIEIKNIDDAILIR